MGNLVGISMTGVDIKTPLAELERLQKLNDKVEFGIILSEHWYENGNRYFDPAYLKHMRGRGLNLCAHLCGSIAKEAIRNNWDPALELLWDNADLFKRVQLNIKGYSSTNPKELFLDVPEPFEEVIIQQNAAYDCGLYYRWMLEHKGNRSLSVLIDGSGGRGIGSPLIFLRNVPKVGYAGGFGPDNIYHNTVCLLAENSVQNFWVDMETKLRTDDWFDIRKAEKVIEEVDRAIDLMRAGH